MVLMPAFFAARIPFGASSSTRHRLGGIWSRSAHRRKISGAGLPCSTSSPETQTANAVVKSNLFSIASIAAFGEEEAMIQDGRLLYVGVTRAKTRLILTYSGEVTHLLPADPGLYERVRR